VDADQYINDPLQGLAEQTAAFERGLGRFFQACAADQAACSGFGGTDPWSAYDELIDQANAAPIPAAGYTPDPRPIDGDDINAAAVATLYAKQLWGVLAAALAQAAAGDGSAIRQLVDEYFYGRDPETGEFDPLTDRYFTLSATEQRYPRNIRTYIEAGDESWGMNEHFSFNNGLVELNWALFPVRAKRAFYGPFRIPQRAVPALVVAARYDTATPYRGALRLVRDLGNARLLTMIGDGHTVYGGNSGCIDAAVEAYLFEVTLPAENTRCRQEVPFAAPTPPAEAQTQRSASQERLPRVRPHVKPLLLP
jgi:pimeloyl-ACP methyl ester carboxylesterase